MSEENNKLYVSGAVIEITRRCNMACDWSYESQERYIVCHVDSLSLEAIDAFNARIEAGDFE